MDCLSMRIVDLLIHIHSKYKLCFWVEFISGPLFIVRKRKEVINEEDRFREIDKNTCNLISLFP